MNINPFLATDGYKTGHYWMYPEGTTLVYSNWTPRHGKHSNVKDSKGVVVFGPQMIMKMIHDMFDKAFFKTQDKLYIQKDFSSLKNQTEELNSLKNKVCQEIKKEYSMYLDTDYDVSHIEALWDLGYLPIEVKALPEGSFCPYGVPALTIKNTLPEFFWLTNFLETLISNLLWLPMTSATSALDFKRTLINACKKTDKENIWFVNFQGHDFSMRGMGGLDATVLSGLGHAAVFQGSDSLPVIYGARKYYPQKRKELNSNTIRELVERGDFIDGKLIHVDSEGYRFEVHSNGYQEQLDNFIVGSVNATEHSVMCAGKTGTVTFKDKNGQEVTKNFELETFRYLMKQFPTGILSIVSDTWDLWRVITEYLVILKDEILARDGKIVIRPDSGNPVDIICGYENTDVRDYFDYVSPLDDIDESNKIWHKNIIEERGISVYKGVIELLWDIFGGTVNEQGYKVLDPHIGAIYGDSITPERAKQICERLEAKGFASTNVVLGIGSYTYQYVTRDTHGFAMKATYAEVEADIVNGDSGIFHINSHGKIVEGREIFKDPVTGDGSKKSAKGLLKVELNEQMGLPNYELQDQVSWEEEQKGALETIFKNGEFKNEITLTEVRNRINTLI